MKAWSGLARVLFSSLEFPREAGSSFFLGTPSSGGAYGETGRGRSPFAGEGFGSVFVISALVLAVH